ISGSVLLLTRLAVLANMALPPSKMEGSGASVMPRPAQPWRAVLLDFAAIERDGQLHLLLVGCFDDDFKMVPRLLLVLDHEDFADLLDGAAGIFGLDGVEGSRREVLG